MSHEWNCPTESEARSSARRDAEDGYSRRRYQDSCPEAAEAYTREYRRESHRLDEERIDERQRQLADERRQEEEEEDEFRQLEDEYMDAQLRNLQASADAFYLEMEEREYDRVNADAEPLELRA